MAKKKKSFWRQPLGNLNKKKKNKPKEISKVSLRKLRTELEKPVEKLFFTN